MGSIDSTRQDGAEPFHHKASHHTIFPQRTLIVCLLLALATVALYNPVTRAPSTVTRAPAGAITLSQFVE